MISEFRRLKWLSIEDLEVIHQNCLEILWERGMRIDHLDIRSRLADAGAKIDSKTRMVRFPPELVENCIKSVPKNFNLGGRFPNNNLTVGLGSGPYTRSVGGTENYLDLKNQAYRSATANDLKEWVHLLDGLENIHICGGPCPNDIPISIRDAMVAKTILENSTKHFMINIESIKQLNAIINMAIAVLGSEKSLQKRPIFSILTSTTAPGIILDYCIEVIMQCGKYGIPVALNSTPNMGGSCPVTIAGAITLTNLEILSLIVISQTANPGTPIMHRGIMVKFDMLTGDPVVASIEGVIAQSALTQLVREKYKIHVDCFAMFADSVVTDGQSQIERTIPSILSAMSGATILSGSGQLAKGLALDPIQLTIDDQIFEIIFRILRGIEVNEATLAKDIIKRVVPGGEFLSSNHTLRHFKDEHIRPKCFNFKNRHNWEADGKKDLNRLAQERALKILKEHQIEPLGKNIQLEINKIYDNLKKTEEGK